MQITIGKKLVGSFLVLAMLVLLSGIVGYFVLNRSADSADTVAKEKAPIQYAVMNAALMIEQVQKEVAQYASSNSALEPIANEISSSLNTFDMWIAMIQYGTSSNDFLNSPYGEIYTKNNLQIVVNKGSKEILDLLTPILEERDVFKQKVSDLMKSHKTAVTYTVFYQGTYYTLPNYLNLVQLYHLNWIRMLKDSVNIETTFTGETDITKGPMAEWLSSYKVDNEQFRTLAVQMKKQHDKLMKLADKINQQESYKKKLRIFNRGIGTTAKIEKYFGEMHTLSTEIYDEIDTTEKIHHDEMINSARNINTHLDSLIIEAANEMNAALATAERVKSKGTIFLIIITLAAVAIAIILGGWISRYLARRIGNLADATKKITAGDLKETINVTSSDELGTLAQDTNSMIENLRTIIGQIFNFSDNLTHSSQALADISRDLEGNATQLSTKAEAATSATNTMSSSMQEIATTANDSMERVTNVAQATEEMTATINEIAKNADQARNVTTKAVVTVEQTTSKMNDLSEAAKEIGEVADVIVAIADQTNLLSLNATIEAARAGEAGKGFAVVANEVKDLASQTNSATENIRNKITAIQKSSDMTISEINEIASVINDINSIVVIIAGAVEEQAATTQQMAEDIGSVSGSIVDMNNIVDSAARVAESVSNDIFDVNTTSNGVQDGSTLVGKNATELAKLAEELQVLVAKFQL